LISFIVVFCPDIDIGSRKPSTSNVNSIARISGRIIKRFELSFKYSEFLISTDETVPN